MEAGRPSSITKTRKGSTTILTRKLFHPIAFFFLIFAIGWNSFLVNWYFGASSGDMPLVFFLFPLVHVAAGLAISYITLCLFFNKTDFSVTNGQLSVKDYPLPLGNSKSFKYEKFKELRIQSKNHSRNRSNSQYYKIMGLTQKGDLKKVVSFLTDENEALYLKQELEILLSITENT